MPPSLILMKIVPDDYVHSLGGKVKQVAEGDVKWLYINITEQC
jgi:hypothetical protein